jgi:NAD(P)-dependent dehydrogenase (short-subunit alcohol dehydrogenase family)
MALHPRFASVKTDPPLLEGRVILITGTTDGIGRKVAVEAGRCGAEVVLLGRRIKRLETTYDEIVAAGGPEPAIYPMDLAGASAHDFEELANRIDAEFGRLDGLLHNAAVLGMLSPIENFDLEVWSSTLHVNTTVPFMLTQVMLPILKKSDDASVIFTTSGVGRRARAYWGAYAVSKFGCEALVQVLAHELTDYGNIRVNALNPGAVRTKMRANAYPAENPGTVPAPEDIAPAYLWLLGPESQGVDGESLDAQGT